MRLKRLSLLCVGICIFLGSTSSVFADRVIQNDSVGEQVDDVTASAEIIAGEAYEAVFNIPDAWLSEQSGQPLYFLGVRVLMVDGPNASQDYCGRFSVELWEEPAGAPQVQNNCTIIDTSTFQTSQGKHKDPGATIFSVEQATMSAPNGPIGYVVQGQPNMGSANFQDLEFSALNMNQGVNLSPVEITTNRVRVGIKALDLDCGPGAQGDAFPIMVSDFDGVQAPGRNFIYGREPTLCPTTRHYTWEDFGPAFGNSNPGDWIIRLIVSDAPGADMDMGMEIDMDTSDMGMSDAGTDADMRMPLDGGFDVSFPEQDSGTNQPDDMDTVEGISITSISPSTASNQSSVDVVILGTGFEPGLEVSLGAELIGVTSTVSGRINATVPEGLEPGDYDVIVTNPDGSSALLPAAFTVTEMFDDSVGGTTGASDEGCGCAAGSSQGGSGLILVLAALAWARLRRRS